MALVKQEQGDFW